ncbi:MAG: hypothetical protein ACI9R3_006462 [Verrucomicrobiales bacterium]|jgi:hypothetical protein
MKFPCLFLAVITLITFQIASADVIHKYNAMADDQSAELFIDEELGEDWTSIDFDPATGVSLTWRSRPGESYTIQDSAGLEEWLELDDGIESDGEETSATVANPGTTARYYRILNEE